MPYYIKARPQLKAILKIDGYRGKTADGNILLWQEDARKAGFSVLTDAVQAMGAVLLTPEQAFKETHGELETPLPQPTDKRFVVADVDNDNDTEPQADNSVDVDTEPDADSNVDTEAEEGVEE